MKYLKYFENIIDEGPYFIYWDDMKIGNNKYFMFMWNIEYKKNKYYSEHVNFSYSYDNIKIETPYANSYFEMQKLEGLIKPDDFFVGYEDICILLYQKLDYMISEYGKLNNRFMKLYNTLKDIKELEFKVKANKYNL